MPFITPMQQAYNWSQPLFLSGQNPINGDLLSTSLYFHVSMIFVTYFQTSNYPVFHHNIPPLPVVNNKIFFLSLKCHKSMSFPFLLSVPDLSSPFLWLEYVTTSPNLTLPFPFQTLIAITIFIHYFSWTLPQI